MTRWKTGRQEKGNARDYLKLEHRIGVERARFCVCVFFYDVLPVRTCELKRSRHESQIYTLVDNL